MAEVGRVKHSVIVSHVAVPSETATVVTVIVPRPLHRQLTQQT